MQRGTQPRPWLVKALDDRSAIDADPGGGVVEMSLRSLSPDPPMDAGPGETTDMDRTGAPREGHHPDVHGPPGDRPPASRRPD